MALLPRIYLDACALSRLTDSPVQLRIVLEGAAVEKILLQARSGGLDWVASSFLAVELMRIPDAQRRANLLALLGLASRIQHQSPAIAARGKQLHALGYGRFDALHLAAAEEARCDWLLTTDDRFLRKAARGTGQPSVRVRNPLDYLKAVGP